jgi:diadenosine tetraphosphate (Ap4A) HIT family hydrolase
MPPCVFCNILSGLAPANFVYRDDLCAAFMDIRPSTGRLVVLAILLVTELDKLWDIYCR